MCARRQRVHERGRADADRLWDESERLLASA
jgi:hypothetical protein